MSLRTPIKIARGLGSAKDGVHHWWVQRVTAVALVPLVVWFVFAVASLSGADYASVRAWVGQPFTTVMLVLLIAVAFHHAQLGLQVVIEDYVSAKGPQIAALILVKFLAVLMAVIGIVAVLRIAFGG
ncbi:MAG: succinate dehydrogenase, hydrophobic membrane anchor protein [Ectothiorhodospiraceae bacterium]|nr:succinate dehydrogenase, hydrophobic membrane anchor protein [Ectothiorhodospiraceae bacterium]